MNKKIFSVSIIFITLFFIIFMINNEAKVENYTDKSVKQIKKSQKVIVIDGLMYQNYNLTQKNWFDAKKYCYELDLIGKGWRLPSIEELDKISNVEKYGKNENFPKNWFKKNYPKNVQHYKGGAYFLKEEFLEEFSITTIKYNIFRVNVWTNEDISIAPIEHYSNNYAYAGDIGGVGSELTPKKDKLLVLCVRDKN